MEDSGKKYPVMELDVEITDAVVQEELNNDQFYPYFKHLVRNNGILKFKLFASCACALQVRFQFEQHGVGLVRDRMDCDLCRDTNQDNSERVGAFLDGFRVCNDKIMDTGKAQEMFAESVKRFVGRDLQAEGMDVAMASEGSLTSALKGASELQEQFRTDTQMLIMVCGQLLEWVDVETLNDQQKKHYASTVALIQSIKEKAPYKEPTKSMKRALDSVADVVREKAKDKIPEAMHGQVDELVNMIDEIVRKRNDKIGD